MTWNELTQPERLALAALSRAMVRIDRSYSSAESQRLHTVAEELGDPEAFWETLELAERTVTGPDHMTAIARGVTRGGARALILDVLEGLAAAETISRAEEEMIAQLRTIWADTNPDREPVV